MFYKTAPNLNKMTAMQLYVGTRMSGIHAKATPYCTRSDRDNNLRVTRATLTSYANNAVMPCPLQEFNTNVLILFGSQAWCPGNVMAFAKMFKNFLQIFNRETNDCVAGMISVSVRW